MPIFRDGLLALTKRWAKAENGFSPLAAIPKERLCFQRVFHGKKKYVSENENFHVFMKGQHVLASRTAKTPPPHPNEKGTTKTTTIFKWIKK